VINRNNVTISDNTCNTNGTNFSGGTVNIDTVIFNAGIGVSDCATNAAATRTGNVVIAGNTCVGNVASGIVTNDSKPITARNNTCQGNGTDTGLSTGWRCGIMSFGVSAGNTLLKSSGDGGEDDTVQEYGIRVNNGDGSSVIQHSFSSGHTIAEVFGAEIDGLHTLYTATTTYSSGGIAAGATVAFNITVNGAALGDFGLVSPPDAASSAGLAITATVVSTNIVKVVIYNPTAGTITPTASGVWTAASIGAI
jgi:parallel beta-helix repeat protein